MCFESFNIWFLISLSFPKYWAYRETNLNTHRGKKKEKKKTENIWKERITSVQYTYRHNTHIHIKHVHSNIRSTKHCYFGVYIYIWKKKIYIYYICMYVKYFSRYMHWVYIFLMEMNYIFFFFFSFFDYIVSYHTRVHIFI